MKIGDLIPTLQDDFADSSLVTGSVIKMHVNHTNPPKTKILIIVGKNDTDLLAAVIVNSNINFKAIRNQVVIDMQYPIQRINNSFLNYDSFVDCTDYFSYSLQAIREKFKSKSCYFMGQIATNDLQEILSLLSKSSIITPIKLRQIGM
jgi:hypothetical protein